MPKVMKRKSDSSKKEKKNRFSQFQDGPTTRKVQPKSKKKEDTKGIFERERETLKREAEKDKKKKKKKSTSKKRAPDKGILNRDEREKLRNT